MEEETTAAGTAEKKTRTTPSTSAMAIDNNNNNNRNRNEVVTPPAPSGGGGGEVGGKNESKKAKSCKGCLYYSSAFKSDSRNPFCVGIPGSVPQVPRYIVGKSELEASQLGSSFKDFKYGCVGYSVYSDTKGQSKDVQDAAHSELPVCVGIEVFVDRKVTTADSVPAHVHNREDHLKSPQSRTQKPAQSVGDEFLKRFTRNAGVVASGVAKNVRKVGNQLKASLDDILYPYKRRPK